MIVKEVNENIYQTFIEIEIVRDINQIKNKTKKNKIINYNTTSLSPIKFLDEIKEYEKKYEREFNNSSYKHRYGILLNILLPKEEISENRLKSIVTKYVRMIIQKEKGLRHIAWVSKKGKANMLHIYIYDREVSSNKLVKRYKRDLYLNKLNNKICSKNDEYAIQIAKKGDVIKDKNNQVKKERFKSTKTRIFAYEKGGFDAFRKRFIDNYIQVLEIMKYKIKNGFIIRRKNLNKAYNRFQKRIIIRVNQSIQYIQNEINKLYELSLKYADTFDVYKYDILPGEKFETSISKVIKNLLEKYRKIFREEVFYINEVEYKLSGYRCDLVEFNCEVLKSEFEKEIEGLGYGW